MKNWALRWPTCERRIVVESFDDALSNAAFSSRDEARRFFLPFSCFLVYFLANGGARRYNEKRKVCDALPNLKKLERKSGAANRRRRRTVLDDKTVATAARRRNANRRLALANAKRRTTPYR